MNEWINGQMNGLTNTHIDKWMDGQLNRQTNGQIVGPIDT